jgi:hypothetical protein
MNKLLLFFFGLIIFSFGVNAQTNTYSPYSRYGIGNIENQSLGRAIGMGGISTGLRLPFELNIENPASYSAIPGKVFLFQVGMKAKRTDYEITSDKNTDYDVWLSSINAGFKGTKYWAMSFGMNPMTSVGYSIYSKDSVVLSDYISRLENYYIGEGGLTQLYLGNSFTYKGLSVGINAYYLFGPIVRHTESTLIDTTYRSKFLDIQNIKVNDINFRYGIQYSDSIFKKNFFTVGAFFETGTELNAKLIRFSYSESVTSSITVKDTIIDDTLSTGKIGLPMSYGIGISYVTSKMIFGIDYQSALWKGVDFFNETPAYYGNSYKIALGAEYTRDYASKQYWKTINFRAGGHYGNTNLILNNQPIKEYGVTFGLGFPASIGTKINIAFEIGKKGTIENNLIMENFYLMHLNFNMTDNWFVRRKFF